MSTNPPTGVELDLNTDPVGFEDQTQITASREFVPGVAQAETNYAPINSHDVVSLPEEDIAGSPIIRIGLLVAGLLIAGAVVETILSGPESIVAVMVSEIAGIDLTEESEPTIVPRRTQSEPVVETETTVPALADDEADDFDDDDLGLGLDTELSDEASDPIIETADGVGLERQEATHPNPYWALPNEIDQLPPLDRVWTASEEETWRAAIVHPHTWQRYRTVTEVHTLRLQGSEVILWDALHDPKFWVRFRALVALGDFGATITTRMAKDAIGNARPGLVTRFIKRFAARPSTGELYTLRQAIRVMPSWQGRFEILKILKKHRIDDNELYLAAGTHDDVPGIRQLATRALARYPSGVAEETRQRLAVIMQQPVLSLEEQDGLRERSGGLGVKKPRIRPATNSADPFAIDDVELYQVDWNAQGQQ